MAEPHWVEGDVPPLLPGATVGLPLFEAAPGAVLFRFPGVGRFLVKQDEATVADLPGKVDPDTYDCLLRRPLDAARSLVEGRFSLRASAVAGPAGAVVISGPNSVANSGLAAALVRMGFDLVADQISSYDAASSHILSRDDGVVLPDRLAAALGLDRAVGQPARRGTSVRSYSVPHSEGPIPVSTVLHVSRGSAGDEPGVRDLQGWEKIECLTRSCWLGPLVGPMGLGAQHFAWAGLAARPPIAAVTFDEDDLVVVADRIAEVINAR